MWLPKTKLINYQNQLSTFKLWLNKITVDKNGRASLTKVVTSSLATQVVDIVDKTGEHRRHHNPFSAGFRAVHGGVFL